MCIRPKCNKTFDTKSSCERHWEHVHLSPKEYRCTGNECTMVFGSLREARNHCKRCRPNTWVKEAEVRAYYSSELADSCSKSRHQVASHLTELGRLPLTYNVYTDYERQLKSLLEHDDYKEHIANSSTRILDHPESWKTLYWDTIAAQNLSLRLERGFSDCCAKERSAGTNKTLGKFLDDLIAEGMKHSSVDRTTTHAKAGSKSSNVSTNTTRTVAQDGHYPPLVGKSALEDPRNPRAYHDHPLLHYGHVATQGTARTSSPIEENASYDVRTQQSPIGGMARYTSTCQQPYYVGALRNKGSTSTQEATLYPSQYWPAFQDFTGERGHLLHPTAFRWNDCYAPPLRSNDGVTSWSPNETSKPTTDRTPNLGS